MRRLILVPLLVGAASCDIWGGASPDATVIAVRVRDDRGWPVNRAEVTATILDSTHVHAKTRSDGAVVIDVADVGTYLVTVIPRDGFVAGSDPLSKQVTVVANARATVDFTLYRVGVIYPPIDR